MTLVPLIKQMKIKKFKGNKLAKMETKRKISPSNSNKMINKAMNRKNNIINKEVVD